MGTSIAGDTDLSVSNGLNTIGRGDTAGNTGDTSTHRKKQITEMKKQYYGLIAGVK